ncbi:endonuclease/exonuclease/phosphatase family protein [Microbacterium dauci]|uniref:Endonuclease/exonuclease/phosphatase family protein n=1 Tax=Microbacterium dauci TaxID=3048008 RepID=A0ABT6ZE86_9MICO|nr:endonuclease/exonuclease/phosphatase family protein [Microbacterium sp. LX3-4]MDJ1114477.1 endonuclease/exonuclease/phosphatase family protein [Microbacterium sp. LX3-4]
MRKTLRTLGIASLVGLVAALAVAPSPATAASHRVTVMTWNIKGDDADMPAVAAFIRSHDPDILMIQEIQQSPDGVDGKPPIGNQVRELESALGSAYTGKLHFGRADHPGEACQTSSNNWVGNAIYTKFSKLSHVTYTLPRLKTCAEGATSVNRSLAGANFALPSGDNVVVWSTHLTVGMDGLAPTQRLQQAQFIESKLGHSDPLILGGDFNDLPGSATHNTFTSNGWTDAGASAGPTAGGSRIDWVMTKRATIHSASSPRPLWNGVLLSDHRPVIVDMTING